MARAWDQTRRWGIVPQYSPSPEPAGREATVDSFREALLRMQREYRLRAQKMRRPPAPGPRPLVHEDAPSMPSEMPGAAKDPSTPEGLAAQKAILDEYTRKNEAWLDTVFYPGEAERLIWEAAREVYEDWETDRRASRENWKDEVYSWAPVLLKIGIGLGGLAAAAYVVWNWVR